MYKIIDEYLNEILKSRNSFELEEAIASDEHSVVMKNFNSAYILIKAFEFRDSVIHACIDVDMATKEVHVSYPSKLGNIKLKNMEYMKRVDAEVHIKYKEFENEFIFFITNELNVGSNYVLNVLKGSKGIGSGWTLENLGFNK